MKMAVVGLNHKTAPVEIREAVAMEGDILARSLQLLQARQGIREAVILSTCNRTEIIATGDGIHGMVEAARDALCLRAAQNVPALDRYLYILVDKDAVEHLFTVASSLDSMVVGEPQILGQVKEAYRQSLAAGACGPTLNRLFHHAFRVAKRVRNETGIAEHAVSVSYAAVELARSIFESLDRKTVLLVGAGEMVELAARHFLQKGVRRMLVTNRTMARAQALAREFGGEAVAFEALPSRLSEADIVLSCTGAPEPVIHAEDVRRALKLRKNRPIFFIDIGVPRDVDAQVNRLENAFLYDIDDLQIVVQENMAQRKAEMIRARQIVEEEGEKFLGFLQSQDVTPTIRQLREMAERVRQQELERTMGHLPPMTDRERRALEAMTQAIVNKILHRPVTHLKREGARDGAGVYVQMVRDLFGFDDPGKER
jgi:glutamyl-tRNA reductase